MDKWQPIRTAPTDGTKFLAVTGSGGMRVDWLDATLSIRQFANERGDDRYTHWMALPALPSTNRKVELTPQECAEIAYERGVITAGDFRDWMRRLGFGDRAIDEWLEEIDGRMK